MAISQKQIAEKLGVSVPLVSRVLTGKAREIGISQQTIDRVLNEAAACGYVRNASALNLMGKPTRTIGVAVYNFTDPFFSKLIEQIQIYAHQHRYSLILTGFINRVPDEQDLLPLHKHSIDGLLIIGSDEQARWLSGFSSVPAARIGHGPKNENSLKITIDENHAARLIANHLLSCGKQNVMYVLDAQSDHALRKAALERAAEATGQIGVQMFCSGEKEPFAAGLQAAKHLLNSGSKAQALVCATDEIAIGALYGLLAAHVKIPDHVAVIGFDDIPFASRITPALTTVQPPLEKMVALAFAAIARKTPARTVCVKGKLIQRDTA